MKTNTLVALLMFLVVLPASAVSQELLQSGDAFPGFTAEDQHETFYEFEPGVKTVLISFDMSTGRKANTALADMGADCLPSQDAIYVASIHGMPGVGRFFAFRKMKKYPHRIILSDDEHLLERFPQKENNVTVVHLNQQAVVESIGFWNPEENLLQNYLER